MIDSESRQVFQLNDRKRFMLPQPRLMLVVLVGTKEVFGSRGT
jgi:hypothetical protein